MGHMGCENLVGQTGHVVRFSTYAAVALLFHTVLKTELYVCNTGRTLYAAHLSTAGWH